MSSFLSECLFKRPTSFDSVVQGLFGDADDSCPLSKILGFAIKRNHARYAPVVNLLYGSCPSDIVGAIAKIIIDAIKAIALFATVRKLGNVVKEWLRMLAPFVANRNPSFFVILGVGAVGFIATTHHAQPCSIEGMVA